MKSFLKPFAGLVCLCLISCTHSQVEYNRRLPVSTGLKPGFNELADHLVEQLEKSYNSPYRIEVETRIPRPEDKENYLRLGDTLNRQIKEGLGKSMVFQIKNDGKAEFFLKPEYRAGEKTTTVHLTLMHKQNRSVAGASQITVDNNSIPPEMFKPAIQSPEDLARIAGEILVEGFDPGSDREDQPLSLFIAPLEFKAHSHPFPICLSRRLAMGFNDTLSGEIPGINLVDTRQKASLVLAGEIIRNDKGVRVHTCLKEIKSPGQVFSSFSGIIQNTFVQAEWFEPENSNEERRPLPEPRTPLPEPDPFKLDLSTQKGKTGLFFKKGDTVTIHAETGKRAFVKIFNVAADGTVVRIYPNAFTSPAPVLVPGQIHSIPADHYDADFIIEVAEPLGEELILALASDQALPDFPAYTQTGHFGVRIIDADFPELKKWVNEVAGEYDAQTSWYALPFRTGR